MYTEGYGVKRITDDAKTPKQKVEKVKELEEKWSAEVKEALKLNMDEKVIDEAAHFFSSVPQQIDLGAK
uniref:PCP_red domain-containing protein n=1 Tax=Globodera pallida TaxID=36090 RepID=A0A183BHJ4_GLOPA